MAEAQALLLHVLTVPVIGIMQRSTDSESW